MRSNILFSALLGLSLSGCYTTYFHNGGPKDEIENMEHSVDYNVGMFGGSKPVDLKKVCSGKDWETVRIKKKMFSWEVAVNCKKLAGAGGDEGPATAPVKKKKKAS